MRNPTTDGIMFQHISDKTKKIIKKKTDLFLFFKNTTLHIKTNNKRWRGSSLFEILRIHEWFLFYWLIENKSSSYINIKMPEFIYIMREDLFIFNVESGKLYFNKAFITVDKFLKIWPFSNLHVAKQCKQELL